LVAHGVLRPPTDREGLLEQMKLNYWDAKDKAWTFVECAVEGLVGF